MTKTLRVSNLDCADCAAKVERALGKLDGVNSASVNFITQKIILDIDEARCETVLESVHKTCKRVEPDMVIRG